MKTLFTIAFWFVSITGFSQLSMTGIPDSVKNINYPGSTGQYSITNPLLHSGTVFTNPPTTISCITNCKADYLYFYDLDLNVPAGSTITGVELIHTRGACNSGSWVIDTLLLAYNGAAISDPKRDSSAIFDTDTLGSSSDVWAATLTPAIVNHNSFGLFIQTTGTGICTFQQANIELKVFYTPAVGIENSTSRSFAKLYPNPVNESFTLEINREYVGSSYFVYDYFGNELDSDIISSSSYQISTSALTSGLYILQIVGEQSQTIKFVKE